MKQPVADFIKGAASVRDFPESTLPEIAFAGRSNVGKSSLINSQVFRKNLAHTSSTPGKTQQINFYKVDDRWMFADMPGFGYAAIGKKHRETWAKLNFEYLEKRENLRLTLTLIDSRHDPMEQDMALMEWLENHAKPYIIVLTKCDKISKKMIEERKAQLEHLISMCSYGLEVLPYSSVSGIGRSQLTGIIKKACA